MSTFKEGFSSGEYSWKNFFDSIKWHMAFLAMGFFIGFVIFYKG